MKGFFKSDVARSPSVASTKTPRLPDMRVPMSTSPPHDTLKRLFINHLNRQLKSASACDDNIFPKNSRKTTAVIHNKLKWLD